MYTPTSRHTMRRGICASTNLCPSWLFSFSVKRPHKLSAPETRKKYCWILGFQKITHRGFKCYMPVSQYIKIAQITLTNH